MIRALGKARRKRIADWPTLAPTSRIVAGAATEGRDIGEIVHAMSRRLEQKQLAFARAADAAQQPPLHQFQSVDKVMSKSLLEIATRSDTSGASEKNK